jgi:hypothetical protein
MGPAAVGFVSDRRRQAAGPKSRAFFESPVAAMGRATPGFFREPIRARATWKLRAFSYESPASIIVPGGGGLCL